MSDTRSAKRFRKMTNSLDGYNGNVTMRAMRSFRTWPALFVISLAILNGAVWAQDTFKSASVEIDGCSGTIIAVDSKWAYGLSAAHCAVVGKSVYLKTFKGLRHQAKWLSKDSNLDLALFRTPAFESAVAVEIGEKSDVIQGFGTHGVKELKFSTTGVIKDRDTGNKFSRAEFIVKKGKFDDGDSGGGVFSAGKLCGVISHGEKEKLYAATPGQILSFIAQQKSLKHSITTSDDWGDRDRTREILALQRQLKELKEQVAQLHTKQATPGPVGPMGPSGGIGPTGPAGRDGRDGKDISDSVFEARIASVEKWIRQFRAVVRVKLVPKEGN